MRNWLLGFLTAAVVAALAGPAFATDAGDWKVRLRGIGFLTDTAGTTNPLGGNARTSNDYKPELDFTYFITKHIGAELILATTRHRVIVHNSSAGDLDLGSVWALPPVLTLQYHFNPDGVLNPYIGAGVNYTITYGAHRGGSVHNVSYSDEFGYAFQAGFDYNINKKWSVNLDVKKVFVSTNIKVNGGAITAGGTNLDPWVIGMGVGYNF